MPLEEPDATSTPTIVPSVKGRPGIRDNYSVQSPIELENSRTIDRTLESSARLSPKQSPRRSPRGFPNPTNRSGSYDSESDQYLDDEGLSSDGDYQPVQDKDEASTSHSSKWIVTGYFVVGFAVIAGLAGLYFSDDASTKIQAENLNQKFNSLEKEFNTQDADFWRNIRVSIQEVPVLHQPRTIILLYNNKAETTLNKILQKISEIALCNLTECSNKAVVIEGAALNTSEIVNDYGKIISKYRNGLKKSGVMIVKNLEKVPGMSAQAFHSFCDDYNPVVNKALIVFTLKVDSLPEGFKMKFVEDFLLKLWSDIGKDDKFYPLLARISSTILSVKPE